MGILREEDKQRIKAIGPNYVKPAEIKYYKQWLRRKKKKDVKENRCKGEKIEEAKNPMSVYLEKDLEFRANCPNIGCLGTVDTEDSLTAVLRFSRLKCGCSWEMNRIFARRIDDFR